MLKIKKGSILLALLFFICSSMAQSGQPANTILCKLDTIRNGRSIAHHFAELYFEITLNSADFFADADTSVQRLVEKMRAGFAGYFFRSADAYEKHQQIPPEWEDYYADSNGSFMRFIFLGINAHINGDIWRTLTTELSQEELKTIRPYYFSYYKQLKKEYDKIYQLAVDCCPRIRHALQLTFGTGRHYGKIMLKRWLRRQMELAELYFTDPIRFSQKLQRLERKMHRLNRLIRNTTP